MRSARGDAVADRHLERIEELALRLTDTGTRSGLEIARGFTRPARVRASRIERALSQERGIAKQGHVPFAYNG
jgi:hypothetical protein